MKSISIQNLFFSLLSIVVIVLMSAQILSNPSYAQASDRMTLFGHWSRTADVRAKQGVIASSSHPGSYMTLQVTGDSFTLFRRMAPNGGRMQVTIDGKNYGILEFYFFEERWSVPAYFDGLGSGQHQVALTIKSSKNNSSSGTMVAIEAVQVPTVLLSTSLQQVAIERANRYRTQAGVPPAQMSMALNVAAQNHANFYTTSWTSSCITDYPTAHYECPPSAPGYTGYSPGNRGSYAGYTASVGEDLVLASDPYFGVDEWINAPYHRNPILEYSSTEMGYGSSTAGSEAGTLLFGTRAFEQPAPASRLIYTYPAHGQTQVPISWNGGEEPDPLPGKPLPVGSVISLYIAQSHTLGTTPPNQWAVNSITLHNQQNQAVPLYVLYQGVDPNTTGPDIVHLFPQTPMALDTTYTARVVGTDSRGVPFDHSWSFTTAKASSIVRIQSEVGAYGASIRWRTTSEVTGYVEYGLTNSYGSVAQPSSTGISYGRASILGLKPGTTYHYRVVTQDTDGEQVGEDRIFITESEPKVIRIPTDTQYFEIAIVQARPGDTILLAAGNYTLVASLSLPAGVHLIGAGADQTVFNLLNGDRLSISGNSVVTGIHFTGSDTGTGLSVSADSSPIIWKNKLTHFETGISSAGNTLIAQNTLIHNTTGVSIYAGKSKIVNNTIANGGRGVSLNTVNNELYNNAITTQDRGVNVNITPQILTYQSFWNNNTDVRGASAGTGTIVSDPHFANSTNDNYALQANSPLRNAGHPNAGFNDSDNTRNDIGASGSPRFVKQLADAILYPEAPEPPPVTPIESIWLLPPTTINPLPATPTRTSVPTHTPRPQLKASLFLPIVAK